MLSDVSIRKLLAAEDPLIEPHPLDQQIQPATVDLLLGKIAWPDLPWRRRAWRRVNWRTYDLWTIEPGDFRLASTLELVTLPADLAGWVAGKSSLARHGLTVEQAGFVDPGFLGEITLELHNVSRKPIQLWPEMPICQIAFFRLDQPADRPYGSPGLGSHYQLQLGPTPSRMAAAPR
ncbi:dCTP deaminase [Dactylosporangium sp. McL0621]|uniref:dCTP deaminase n=1 Tax=Dactylosporangium sp. McL0621 TaxID=3415678 RepID=UPI003CEFCCD1